MQIVHDIKQHLYDRKCKLESYSSIHIDEANNVATFMLSNFSGQVAGYQRYNPFGSKLKKNKEVLGKYYTRLTDPCAVWGLETYYGREDILFLVEGVFDACTLHTLGYPAIAVLTNNPKPLKNMLSLIPRKLIAVCDGNKAGSKLAMYAAEHVQCPEGMDPNGMDIDILKQMIEVKL